MNKKNKTVIKAPKPQLRIAAVITSDYWNFNINKIKLSYEKRR